MASSCTCQDGTISQRLGQFPFNPTPPLEHTQRSNNTFKECLMRLRHMLSVSASSPQHANIVTPTPSICVSLSVIPSKNPQAHVTKSEISPPALSSGATMVREVSKRESNYSRTPLHSPEYLACEYLYSRRIYISEASSTTSPTAVEAREACVGVKLGQAPHFSLALSITPTPPMSVVNLQAPQRSPGFSTRPLVVLDGRCYNTCEAIQLTEKSGSMPDHLDYEHLYSVLLPPGAPTTVQ